MANKVEWAKANDINPTYEEIEDAYGSESDGKALLINGGGGTTYAIEGTQDEIRNLLLRMAVAISE